MSELRLAYEKPQIDFWAADRLDAIEAKMSGGGGGGGVPWTDHYPTAAYYDFASLYGYDNARIAVASSAKVISAGAQKDLGQWYYVIGFCVGGAGRRGADHVASLRAIELADLAVTATSNASHVAADYDKNLCEFAAAPEVGETGERASSQMEAVFEFMVAAADECLSALSFAVDILDLVSSFGTGPSTSNDTFSLDWDWTEYESDASLYCSFIVAVDAGCKVSLELASAVYGGTYEMVEPPPIICTIAAPAISASAITAKYGVTFSTGSKLVASSTSETLATESVEMSTKDSLTVEIMDQISRNKRIVRAFSSRNNQTDSDQSTISRCEELLDELEELLKEVAVTDSEDTNTIQDYYEAFSGLVMYS